jgi:hypothetical protein
MVNGPRDRLLPLGTGPQSTEIRSELGSLPGGVRGCSRDRSNSHCRPAPIEDSTGPRRQRVFLGLSPAHQRAISPPRGRPGEGRLSTTRTRSDLPPV